MLSSSINMASSIILIIAYSVSALGAPYSVYKENSANFDQNENILDVAEPRQPLESGFAINNYGPNVELGQTPQLYVEEEFPNHEELKKLGQISGLAAYKNDTLYVFHRNDRFWGYGLSDLGEINDEKMTKPIKNDTVCILDHKSGQILKSWGADSFYMPHGINVDSDGNVWLTDVFRHQVVKYKRDSYDKPELVLGEAFVSGQDDQHFCMPTDVAVSSTGIIYISDGYCNSRIMIYSPYGEPIDEIALEENMVIPHSLTLIEEENLICVADREKRRVLCYESGLDGLKPGMLMADIEHPRLNRIFAIDHLNEAIFALSVADDPAQSEAALIDIQTERLMTTVAPKKGFKEPHDLSISPDGKYVFISDISPGASRSIYKFKTIG